MKHTTGLSAFLFVLVALIAVFLAISCSQGDDDDSLSPGSDATGDDDDDSSVDDDDDDDDNDDDTVANQPYRGQMRPCDVDGLPGGEIVVLDTGDDSFGSILSTFARLRRVDGTEIDAFEVVTRSKSYDLWVEAQLVDLNADEKCEVVLTAESHRWDTAQYESRALVLEGGELTIVYDTDWRYGRHISVVTDVDVNGGGADLLVETVDDFGKPTTLEAIDGVAGFTPLWQVEADPKYDIVLHGRRGETGAAFQACATLQGPSFLLEQKPRFGSTPVTWSAAWIDPAGGVLANLDPIDMTGSKEMSSGLMPLPEDGGCAFFVTHFDEAANHGRFRLYGPDGLIAQEGVAPDGVQWEGRGDADLDADGAADLLFWVEELGGPYGVWAAPAADDFTVREIAVSDQEIIKPVVWLVSPWLYGGAEFTGPGKVFFIGPFVERAGLARNLQWLAYDQTLAPAGLTLTIPMSFAQGFTGFGTAFWDGDAHPRIALYIMATRVYWFSDKGIPYIDRYRWGMFGEQDTLPLFLSEETLAWPPEFTFPWDFNLDGRTDLGRGFWLSRLTQTREINDVENDMAPLFQTKDGEYAVIGQRY
jgi:hypothetical protein